MPLLSNLAVFLLYLKTAIVTFAIAIAILVFISKLLLVLLFKVFFLIICYVLWKWYGSRWDETIPWRNLFAGFYFIRSRVEQYLQGQAHTIERPVHNEEPPFQELIQRYLHHLGSFLASFFMPPTNLQPDENQPYVPHGTRDSSVLDNAQSSAPTFECPYPLGNAGYDTMPHPHRYGGRLIGTVRDASVQASAPNLMVDAFTQTYVSAGMGRDIQLFNVD